MFEQRLGGSEAVSVARKENNRCRGPEASGFVGKSWGGGSRARGGGVGCFVCVTGSEL